MILWNFLLGSILPLSSIIIIIQNANGLYVPMMYGKIDYEKCHFISGTGEIYQIYRLGKLFMFGRVYWLDEQNAYELIVSQNEKCLQMDNLGTVEMETHVDDGDRIVPKEPTQTQHVSDSDQHGPEEITTNVEVAKTTVLTKGEDDICRIKSAAAGGLDFPIFSCRTMSTVLKIKNPCRANQYFYLQETMDKKDETMPKVVAFTLTNAQIEKCGQIEPIGRSEFVKKTRIQKWRGRHVSPPNDGPAEVMPAESVGNEESEKVDSDLEKSVEKVEARECRWWEFNRKKKIEGNWLIYKGLSIMVNRMKCDNVKTPVHSKNSVRAENNSLTTELKKTGFQMMLICEDMKGMLVQITKKNLENGTLKFADLHEKMQKTIKTLKDQYEKSFGSAQKPDTSFKDVLKDMHQQFKTMRRELFGSKKLATDESMAKRLKTFAGYLLYFLEKTQHYFHVKADWSNLWIFLLITALAMAYSLLMAFLFLTPPGWIVILCCIVGSFITGILLPLAMKGLIKLKYG